MIRATGYTVIFSIVALRLDLSYILDLSGALTAMTISTVIPVYFSVFLNI